MSEFVEGATTPPVVPAVVEPVQTPVETNAVDEWVGEGKKYKDVSELAKAYTNADQRLEELKLANETLASEKQAAVDSAKGVDEVLAAISAQSAAPTATPVVADTPSVTPEKIQELIAGQLSTQRTEDAKAQKVKDTWGMMDEAFGDREAASKAVQSYMGDDAGKKAIVNSMAVSDPIGLMKLLGKDVTKKPVTFTVDHATSASGDTINLQAQLTWDTANKIRREDPKTYYSLSFRKRMREELN